jgi:glyoxylase-like metal-dependent hydrolase (beta-lactamase superfamily II)
MSTTTEQRSGRVRLGELELVALADGLGVDWPEPLPELFLDVDPTTWPRLRAQHPSLFPDGDDHGWRLDVLCHLIRSPEQVVLVDTGMGPADSGYSAFVGSAGRLLDLLAREGLAPEDVDVVVFTHLHPDHIGWNRVGAGAARRLTFPNARYVAPARDWETFQAPEVEAEAAWPFVRDLIDPLAASGRLELVGEGHAVTPELTVVELPGHTHGHAGLLVDSHGEQALVTGDAFLHPVQLEAPEVSMLREMDRAAAIRTRRMLLERLRAQDAVFVASHFPAPGFGRIAFDADGTARWEPLAAAAAPAPR